ncbi:uncharacterized protein LOC135483187 [Lineus longissimus]|uniref:uncharacterized protein LOC135483187 n=1 Tax=Lineus longissimus TaxID=88925 RepID=UPI002B4D7766
MDDVEHEITTPPNSEEEEAPQMNEGQEPEELVLVENGVAAVEQQEEEEPEEAAPAKPCQRCSKTEKVFELSLCKHEVCKRCLPANIANSMESDIDDERRLELAEADCPLCQKRTIFPEEDVASFPPPFQNFSPVKEVFDLEHVHMCANCSAASGTETEATGRCIDCRLYVCEPCSAPDQHGSGEGQRHRIFTLDEIKSGGSFEDVEVIKKVDPTHCNAHKGCKIERWCCTCALGICESCLRQHRDHVIFELSFFIKEMENYIKHEGQRTAETQESLAQAISDAQKNKETRMQDFQSMAEKILSIAEARKARIDEDTGALMLQLKTLKDVYENETGHCESNVVKKNTVLGAFQRINQTLLGNGSGITDDRIIRMYQFLRANEQTIDRELKEINSLSHDVRDKFGRSWRFEENVPLMISGGDNVVGRIAEPDTAVPIFKTLTPSKFRPADSVVYQQRPVQEPTTYRPADPIVYQQRPVQEPIPSRSLKSPSPSHRRSKENLTGIPKQGQTASRPRADDDLRRSYTIHPAPSRGSDNKGKKGHPKGTGPVSPKLPRRRQQEDALRASYTVSRQPPVKTKSAEDDNHTVFLKVLILGDQVVGKTRLLHKLMHMEEDKDPRATLGLDCGARKLVVSEDLVMFSLWELAGKDSYRDSLSLYTKDIQMLLIVYDVARRKTYEDAELWLREARKTIPERIPIVLIGNTELIHNHPEWIRKRQVDVLEAEDWAARHGLYFAEISVRDSAKKLEKTFRRIMIDILKNEIGSNGTRQLDYLGRKFRMTGARDDSVCRVQ